MCASLIFPTTTTLRDTRAFLKKPFLRDFLDFNQFKMCHNDLSEQTLLVPAVRLVVLPTFHIQRNTISHIKLEELMLFQIKLSFSITNYFNYSNLIYYSLENTTLRILENTILRILP